MVTVEHFNHVVLTILPVFVVIGIGFVAVKGQLLPDNSHKALAAFVLNIALPAAIFSALSTKSFNEIWHLDYVLIYTLGSLVIFTLVAALSVLLLHKSVTEGVILGLGSSFSNSLLIGFPIIYFLFGDKALAPFTLTLLVENLILLPLLLALAEIANGSRDISVIERVKETLNSLLKNPIVLAISFGLLASLINLEPPAMAERVVGILANTVSGVALFTIGAGLVGVNTRGMHREIGVVMMAKLILHPIALLVLLAIGFDLEPSMAAVAVILASMPMFGVYAVIGQKYNMGSLCSAVLLPTTVMAMVTVSLVTAYALVLFNLN